MSHGRDDQPPFYLLADDAWPKSRRGPSFLVVMRDAAQRRFRDPRWQGLASTYRFTTTLPPTNVIEPDSQAEVTRILEWHARDTYIERYHADDRDENAPSGVLVRRWMVYDLNDADWQRARDIESACRARSDTHMREFDELLDAFAQAALDGLVSTFSLGERDGAMHTIPVAFWMSKSLFSALGMPKGATILMTLAA